MGAVSASDSLTNAAEKNTVKATSTIIDQGTYSWKEYGYSCYYTWKDYKYSKNYVVVNYNYKHQSKTYTGQLKIINKASAKYKNDLYVTSSGNMWEKQIRGFIGANQDASTYASNKLYSVNRQGSIKNLVVHPSIVWTDDRVDWEIVSFKLNMKTSNDYYKTQLFQPVVTIRYSSRSNIYKGADGTGIVFYFVKSKNIPAVKYRNYHYEPSEYSIEGISAGPGIFKGRVITKTYYGEWSSMIFTNMASGNYMVAAIINANGAYEEYDYTNNIKFSPNFYYKKTY